MCMGSTEVVEDTANQERAAELARLMEEDWMKRFQPWEQELAGDLLNQNAKIKQQVDDAQQDAAKSFEASKSTAQRNMARYGGQMDADQQAALAKSQNISGQGAQIGAMDVTRQGSAQRYDQMMQEMVNVGRGVQGQGLQGIQQGVGLEAQRNQIAYQNAGASNAARYQLMGTAAGLGGAALIMSDKNTKTNIRKASTKKALKEVERVTLKHWDYKPGMGNGREETGHTGGMAQDMPDSMTTRDKRQVEVGDTLMTLMGATQELSKRMGRLEKRNAGRQ